MSEPSGLVWVGLIEVGCRMDGGLYISIVAYIPWRV